MNLPQRIAVCLFIVVVSGFFSFGLPRSNFTIVDAARHTQPVDAVLRQLAGKRVVFIGEEHERYDNHLDQLDIIRRLHASAPDRWVVGVEYVQRRFQPYLNAYVEKKIDEREFLRRTEYFERWGYDYALYRPIFQYARDNGIPMVALNAERELTDAVDKSGLAGMTSADRSRLPQHVESPDQAYRDRLRKIFQEHSGAFDFERFVEVQSVWDETMAEQIADYLTKYPDKAMIVLAGEGHVAFGLTIPDRVKHRLPGIQTAVFVPADDPRADLEGADYLLVSRTVRIPPPGKLGMTLDTSHGVTAKGVTAGSAAAKAGLRLGDRVTAIDDQPVESLTDFRLALLDKKPGEQVQVRIRRGAAEEDSGDLTLHVRLQK